MKDRVGVEIAEGDFVVYVTKVESPGLEFGWVLGYHQSKSQYSSSGGSEKIKIHKAEPDGTRLNKIATDVPGHYRDDTPLHIRNSRLANGDWYRVTTDEHREYYVPTTYRDTGKPDTTMLDAHGSYRIMVVKPV